MSVSTHVLDAVLGAPAANIPVRLDSAVGADWTLIATRTTDSGGRVADLAGELDPGIYRLVFDVADHLGPSAFYPEVTVTFRIVDGATHHHVPLLLSPFAYSTYRGS
jgi:5-hydroxyisourate hydrolase